jgi:hypothetical protein
MVLSEVGSVRNGMTALQRSIGTDVKVEYVLFGNPASASGKLREVKEFSHIGIEVKEDSRGREITQNVQIPFVGLNAAIRTVSVEGKTIYDNRHNVPENLRMRTLSDSHAVKARSFGVDAAGPAPAEAEPEAAKASGRFSLSRLLRRD